MPYTVIETGIPGALLLQPKVFGDDRGIFFESFNLKAFEAATGLRPDFVQDNQSLSIANVLRGLHYQIGRPQGKLIRAVSGDIFDVAVDLRRRSPTFGKWTGAVLSAANKTQFWIPEGFAHGFVVRSETAEVLYKTTDYWAMECERCIRWNDSTLNIDWALEANPIVSAKDAQGANFLDIEPFA